jgi:hypothetical protein
MVVVVDDAQQPGIKFATGKIAGFDFGLKRFSLVQMVLRLNHLNSSIRLSIPSRR